MPFTNDLLRSLTKSEQKPIETRIEGCLPEWLNGTLFRNGPGRFKYGDKSYKHLFDGHACVHKFKIENGKVVYSNKFIETMSYKKTLNENRLYPVFGTVDICSSFYERFKTIFSWPETLDNVNVSVVPFGKDRLFALTEINVMYEISASNLDTLNRININDYIPKATTTFAHPHYLQDGNWLTMGMNTKSPTGHYEFLLYPAENTNEQKIICQNAQVIASVPSSHLFGLSYFHSFGLTPNYIIFLEQCLILDLKSFLSCLLNNKAYSDALLIKQEFSTKIFIINRLNNQILKQKFYTQPLIVFHHINSFEIYENSSNKVSHIICDVCAYDPKYFDIKNFNHDKMYTQKLLETNGVKSIGKRIRIPLNLSLDQIYCDIEDINSQVSFELPVINYERFNGKPYKYIYGVNYFKLPFSIVKINLENPQDIKQMAYAQESKNFLPSEPIFVENANPSSEDDGVLLVMVLSDQNDFLSILSAKDLKELARANIPKEAKAAFTFHGFFADKNKFKKLNS